jgi:hypothetical protein
MTKETAAYIAGLIDGEGSLTRQRASYPVIKIGMTHKPTIDWLASTLEVNCRALSTKPGHQQMWGVGISGNRAMQLLSEVRPYLITKADKADDLLTWVPGKAANGADRCKRGHLRTPENTNHRGDGRRQCRACMRIHKKAYLQRKKEAQAAAHGIPIEVQHKDFPNREQKSVDRSTVTSTSQPRTQR